MDNKGDEMSIHSGITSKGGQGNLLSSNVGVVVIGRNEAVRLQSTLQAVVRADVPLIYVDSQSKDKSVELAKSLDINVLVLSEDKPINASRARNEGARLLMEKFPQLNYLQFLDGDTTLDREWLAVAFKHLESNPDIGFVCGQLREKDRDKNIYRRLCDMEWRWEAAESAEPCRLGGMGMMRLRAFTQSGGYDESLIAGADPELYARIEKDGWVLQVLGLIMGVHDSGMQSFRQWWIRSVKTGFGFANGRVTGAWGRERRSAIVWAGFLPLLSVLMTIFVTSWAILLLFMFPLNICRIWASPVKREFSKNDRLLYAASCMTTKIPQFIGIVKYHWCKHMNQTASVIQYK